MLVLFSARAIIESYITGNLRASRVDRGSVRVFVISKPSHMERIANPCEHLRTAMLTAVFDLVYGTFWVARSERKLHAETFLRVQVIVRRLAETLSAGPMPDGTTPRRIRECVGRLAEEVERLGRRRDFDDELIVEARLQLDKIDCIADQMVAHCSEMATQAREVPKTEVSG